MVSADKSWLVVCVTCLVSVDYGSATSVSAKKSARPKVALNCFAFPQL